MLNPTLLLVVKQEEDRLTLLPSFWRTAQILEPVRGDRFRSLLAPSISFEFLRDEQGTIKGLRTTGHEEISGEARRLAEGEFLPVEHLLAGKPKEAVEVLVAAGLKEPEPAVRLGFDLMRNFPSRATVAVAYFEELLKHFPKSPTVETTLGAALVLGGAREAALPHYRRAFDLDPGNFYAAAGLRHLDPEFEAPEPDGTRKLPFSLDEVFAPPSLSEIEAVRREWMARDLSPEGIKEEAVHSLETAHGRFSARIVSHLVHGSRHYGAVVVPEGATPGCCPVVLDIRGVAWDYPPRDISGGLRTMEILREDSRKVVFVVPGLRGEVLQFGGASYVSEGDRTDTCDGPTDDTMALLSVILETTPEADGERVCVYGKSRGGTVALLVGSRDSRIDCVVDWAGPVDWFEHMGSMGWTLRELVSDGLRLGWEPGRGMGSSAQFIEWFLKEPIEKGKPGLSKIRHRITASSPLYFVENLPPSDLHYGVEDRSVPVANGRALEDRLTSFGESCPPYQMFLHEKAGHDMPFPRAHDITRKFLLEHLTQ